MSDLRTTFSFKPKPTVSSSWATLRGHWLPVSKDHEVSAAWRTMSDVKIGNCFSEENRYKMLRIAWTILLQPGHYAALVEELYPDSADGDEGDPLDATYLTSGQRFRPESYSEVDYKAVIHYLRGELKIPRIAALYNLEPFVRLATSIDIASRIMAQIDLQDTVEDSASPWSREPTFLEATYGRRCRVIQPVLFDCGPFPLRDRASGPVCWQIPPPSLRDAVAEVRVNLDWVPGPDRDRFSAQHRELHEALGVFGCF